MDLLNADKECKFLVPEHVEGLVDKGPDGVGRLGHLSQYSIRNVFRDMEFCDPVHGVFGAQTVDCLHVVLIGLIKSILTTLFESFSDRQNSDLDKLARNFARTQKSGAKGRYPIQDLVAD